MDLDLLIRGGTVVDGSGSPASQPTSGCATTGSWRSGRCPMPPQPRWSTPPVASSVPGSSTSTSIPRPPSAGTARSGARSLQGVTTHLTAPDGFGWAPLAPDQSADLWRSTAFAYGQPDLRPEWPTIESYLAGFAGITPVNVVPMAPHQAIRFAVLGLG